MAYLAAHSRAEGVGRRVRGEGWRVEGAAGVEFRTGFVNLFGCVAKVRTVVKTW